MFRLNAPVALMTMGAFSLNISKLFSELKLVTDNHPLCVYGSAYSENLGVGQPCSQVIGTTWLPEVVTIHSIC